jgi:hypothetical protein
LDTLDTKHQRMQKRQRLGILYLNPFPQLAPNFILTKATLCAFRLL